VETIRLDKLSLWRQSGTVFADDPVILRIKHRLEFPFRVSRDNRQAIEALLSGPGGVHLQRAMHKDPRIIGFITWPFLNKDVAIADRFHLIAQHNRILSDHYPWMQLAFKEKTEVLDLGEYYPGLQLVVENAPWFLREGCLNFSLMLDERRLMTLSFTMAQSSTDLDCYIGSMQGSSDSDSNDMYKAIAEQLHEVRPRDFLFKTFRIFARNLDVKMIHCIDDSCHIRNHAFFRGGRNAVIQLPYDAMWIEHGAVARGDGFFSLASGISERPLSDVPQKKRGRYKRRLEMFQTISERMDLFAQTMRAGNAPKVKAENAD
jgi:uncharacterized protein VirK/YbjX